MPRNTHGHGEQESHCSTLGTGGIDLTPTIKMQWAAHEWFESRHVQTDQLQLQLLSMVLVGIEKRFRNENN